MLHKKEVLDELVPSTVKRPDRVHRWLLGPLG